MLTYQLLIASFVIICCVLLNRLAGLFGIPMLFAFIILGMLAGSDGLLKIAFSDFRMAESLCTIALILIIFYGGFGTRWKEARPVVWQATLLSTVGIIITAGLSAVFCRYVLHIPWLESCLIGAVISSTDAASVFSILRTKRLNLKNRTASLLEMESGSNDPVAFMLTILFLSLMEGKEMGSSIPILLITQILIGIICGALVGITTAWLVERVHFAVTGFDTAFVFAVILLAYALPASLSGNGYLSVYVAGLIMGNRCSHQKRHIIHFFDGITGLMQMFLFFLLGLLSFPSELPKVAGTALVIALFLTFAARPLSVFLVMAPFRTSVRQMLLVSWSGLRGAASITFAVIAMNSSAHMEDDIFHIVFFIVLFSILLQGTLLPYVARWLNMIDEKDDVMKTFTDYSEEVPVQFIESSLNSRHPWVGRSVSEIELPPDSLLVLLLRDREKIVPYGNTKLLAGDKLILSAPSSGKIHDIHLSERIIKKGDDWIGSMVREVVDSPDMLVIMIQRKGKIVIPDGNTVIREKDILVINYRYDE